MTETKTEEMHLRHVETDVLIPKMMRDKARVLCEENVKAFSVCCRDSGFLMVVKCRPQNSALKACLTQHYTDPAFFEECKKEYIAEKLEFQRTGVPAKNRSAKLQTSM